MHSLTPTILLTLFLTLLSFSASLPAQPANLSALAFSPLLHPTSDDPLTLALTNTSLIDPSKPTLTSLRIGSYYRIPQTSPTLWLRVRLDEPRVPLSEFDIGGILALANDTLQEDIHYNGADTLFPVWFAEHTRQWFVEILRDSYHPLCVSIKSERTGREFFTNGQLADVIRGLDTYLRLGRRCYQAHFAVFQGLFATKLLGAGIIARLTPIDPSGVQSS